MTNIRDFYDEYVYAMKTVGFYLVKNCINTELVNALREEIDAALVEDQNKYDNYKSEHRFYDIIHCLLARKLNKASTSLFQSKELLGFVDMVIGNTSIVHSYNAVVLNPFSENNAVKIHRDTPRFYDNSYPLSIQALVCIDEFNETTGATHLLPGSHHISDKPSTKYFYDNAYKLNAKPGDVLFFDSLIWHCAGQNTSEDPRRGITIVYTRSFMKQQIDLTSCLTPEYISTLDETGKRLVGINVRPPKDLHSFFLPEDERTYKSNQG